MPVSKGRKPKAGARAKAARQRQARGERVVTNTVRQFGAVADLADKEALNEVHATVTQRVMRIVSDRRHGKIRYTVIPSREESRWRDALAGAGDGSAESNEAVVGLIEFLASSRKAALVVAECAVYGGQQRSKASLS